MKNRQIVCIVMLLLAGLAFGSQTGSAAEDWPKSMIYVGSRAGSAAYAAGVGISALISKYVGVKTVPEAGAAAKNAVLLHKKEVHFSNVQSDTAYEAVRGLESFKELGKMNIRLMFTPSLTTPCAFIVRRDSGITSVRDLKGKKVMSVNPSSPAFTKSADMMLEAMGMSRKDITAIQFSGFAEAGPALQEGRISACIHPHPATGIGPFLQEFNASVPARLIAAPWDRLEPLLPKYPYFSKAVLSAKDYGDITNNKDLITIGFKDLVVCRGDLPENLVFEAMKAIFDHLEELYSYHPVTKSWTDDPLSPPIVPFHPGAIKYYKGKGLWTKELEDKQKKLLAEVSVSR
jgi:TRAP transporter TAXI family solute receptor